MEQTFKAKHREFYGEFEKWRIKMLEQKQHKDGVYILHANKPINRMIATDNYGILYIGKGIILDKFHRVGKLINAINNTERMHSGGVRLRNEKILQLYPVENMTLKIRLCENARNEEKQLLNDYEDEYGELPPFNRQGGK